MIFISKIYEIIFYFLARNRPKTSHERQILPPMEDPIASESIVTIHQRPQTSHGNKQPSSARPVEFLRSKFQPIDDQNFELGIVPDYLKKYKCRVSFEKFPGIDSSPQASSSKASSSKTNRRPLTPRFSSRLEKIDEEPELIGDGDQDEESFTKFQSEIDNLKQAVTKSIDTVKINCEETQKSLFEKVESLNMKMARHQKELELSRDKTREIANLLKKNEALNTSLKHKADENLKLKRELNELKNELQCRGESSIETISMCATNL